MYDLETGKPQLFRGRPSPRPVDVPPPCEKLCPKSKPFWYSDLLPQNAEALQHYQECSAVGHFPQDPIVARHASLLRQVERAIERGERREDILLTTMTAMLPSIDRPKTKR